MKTAIQMSDGRLLARIINLAHRFGCGYTHVQAQADGDKYAVTIDLDGPADSLRRLKLQLDKIVADDNHQYKERE